MDSQPDKHIIVVLGMHRSGTSATTRGLQVLGVELGNRLMAPTPGVNDKGFWEDLDICALNIAILKELGQDWHTLAPLCQKELASDRILSLKAQAAAVLHEKLEKNPVFGIKDPRLSRLLPFWKPIFDYLKVRASYVIVLRNPLSVIDSIKKRDGFPIEKIYYLWLEHCLSSFLETAGASRVVIDYDLLMDQPQTELRRIARALGLRFVADSDALREYQGLFLEEALRHTRYSAEDLSLDVAAPKEVKKLYRILMSLSRDELRPDSPDILRAIHRTQQYVNRLRPALSYMTRCEGQISSLHQEVADREGRLRVLYQAMSERDGQIIDLRQAMAERERQIAALNRQIELLVASHSWRITRPLRALRRYILEGVQTATPQPEQRAIRAHSQ